MKVLLIDADYRRDDDEKFPNLALMKWSAIHQAKNDLVYPLNNGGDPNIIYVSSVFTKNRSHALSAGRLHSNAKIEVGGSGVSLTRTLPNEVEHIMPDYSLYDCDFSMGFTSRGCIRKCPWCVVPIKEGYIRDHAPITEFLHPDHDKLILLDNNFMASPKMRNNLEFIRDHDLKVSFNQGLDIRLIDEDVANTLADINYYNGHFTAPCLYFSFDTPEIEPYVRQGVEILKNAGIKPRLLTFYILCGFATTHEQDLHRFKVLRELGVVPYIMIYNDLDQLIPNDPKKRTLKDFERWINNPRKMYKIVPWEGYDSSYSFKKWRNKNKINKQSDINIRLTLIEDGGGTDNG